MRITFLGTGTSQGVPVIGCHCPACSSEDPRDIRLRSSILVEHEDMSLVVDTGPDFRQQMLTHHVGRLDAILFTHEHRDHIAGLDDIRSYNFIQKKSMDVYAEDRVIRALKGMFPYIFAEKKYPGVPSVATHSISPETFLIGDLEVIPIRLMHYMLPVLGFRFGDFAYVTDANRIPEKEMGKLTGVRHLVVSALRREPHVSHFTLSEAIELIETLGAEQGYLTHISHQMGPVADLKGQLPANVMVAYDGLVIDMKK